MWLSEIWKFIAEGFSPYWKEIAVILAGVFAIFGAVSDVRDRRTNKITSWGRIFFLLTILSMIGEVLPVLTGHRP